VRLAQSKADYENRKHFFGIAARVMRQILVDHARARSTAKRGAAMIVALDQSWDFAQDRDRILLSLDDALNALSQEDEGKARLVEMRFFGGMTAEEIADSIGVPVHVVRRDLRSAQIRLREEIER
jgi:RNA polymerase sigma factor (TIGR02999 family)